MLANTGILKHTSVCIYPFKAYKVAKITVSQTEHAYSETSFFLLLTAFHMTAKPYERVTAIETTVRNLYRLTKFYHLIMSTGISPIPTGSHERCIYCM